MFDSKRTWAEHEIARHRRIWMCPVCYLKRFPDSSALASHLRQSHAASFADTQIETLLKSGSRPAETVAAHECPLCDWEASLRPSNRHVPEHVRITVTSQQFMKHLARHLEQLALFALPIPAADAENDDSVGVVVASLNSSRDEASRYNACGNSSNSAPSSNGEALPGHEQDDQVAQDDRHAASGKLTTERLERSNISMSNAQATDSWIRGLSKRQTERPLHDDTDSETRSNQSPDKGLCPVPSCGRHVKDLKTHMLTHQNERPEKCPIPTCEYHIKGFARKYDKNRHILTHYKGTMVCGFCPSSGSAAKSFNRADVFKRHLTSVHNVEQVSPKTHRKNVNKRAFDLREAQGVCSICDVSFASAQDFYEHLDDCVFRAVQLTGFNKNINEKLLSSVSNDKQMEKTSERHTFPAYVSSRNTFAAFDIKVEAGDHTASKIYEARHSSQG